MSIDTSWRTAAARGFKATCTVTTPDWFKHIKLDCSCWWAHGHFYSSASPRFPNGFLRSAVLLTIIIESVPPWGYQLKYQQGLVNGISQLAYKCRPRMFSTCSQIGSEGLADVRDPEASTWKVPLCTRSYWQALNLNTYVLPAPFIRHKQWYWKQVFVPAM